MQLNHDRDGDNQKVEDVPRSPQVSDINENIDPRDQDRPKRDDSSTSNIICLSFSNNWKWGIFFADFGSKLCKQKTGAPKPIPVTEATKIFKEKPKPEMCGGNVSKSWLQGALLVKSRSLNECKSGVCYVLKNLSFRDTNDAGNLMSVFFFLNEHCESMNYFGSMQKLQKHFQPTTLSSAQSLCSPKRFIPAIF